MEALPDFSFTIPPSTSVSVEIPEVLKVRLVMACLTQIDFVSHCSCSLIQINCSELRCFIRSKRYLLVYFSCCALFYVEVYVIHSDERIFWYSENIKV